MKLNNFFLTAPAIPSCTSMLEIEWMIFERPMDFIIRTHPNRVRSLALHISSLVCNFLNLRLKLRSLFSSSYEKWITPRILTGLCIHFISRGLVFLFVHVPSQIAFMFIAFSSRCRLAIFPKSQTISKAFSMEIKSTQNRFVSSANCESLSSFPNKLIPLTDESLRILIEKISPQRMNGYGERGHPCLTPFNGWNQFKLVEYP